MRKSKNILFAGLIIFTVGLFNPIAHASQSENDASLSNTSIEEIRNVALTKTDVIAVETEQIRSLKVKEDYISLQVVRESDTSVLNISNNELSKETNQEIKDKYSVSSQKSDVWIAILGVGIAAFLFACYHLVTMPMTSFIKQ